MGLGESPPPVVVCCKVPPILKRSLLTGKQTTARFLAKYAQVLSLAGQQARTGYQHDPGKADTIQMAVIREKFGNGSKAWSPLSNAMLESDDPL
jgi:hypothetical protein